MLSWPRAAVFALFEDETAWPEFFPALKEVEWTTPRPFGVGTKRTVTLDTNKGYEHYFLWEPGHRNAFYFEGTALPMFRAFAEDYQLHDLDDGDEGRCRFVYRIAAEPNLLVAAAALIAKPMLRGIFAGGAEGLVAYCDTHEPPTLS